jgi:hypothetical protein
MKSARQQFRVGVASLRLGFSVSVSIQLLNCAADLRRSLLHSSPFPKVVDSDDHQRHEQQHFPYVHDFSCRRSPHLAASASTVGLFRKMPLFNIWSFESGFLPAARDYCTSCMPVKEQNGALGETQLPILFEGDVLGRQILANTAIGMSLHGSAAGQTMWLGQTCAAPAKAGRW